jgi:lipopolysaccharide/colanic/teichoic acid biosynthesis glycosyltransferase
MPLQRTARLPATLPDAPRLRSLSHRFGAGTWEETLPPAALAGAAEAEERLLRVMNLTLAAVGLVLAAPLMAVIALAIRLTSRGPVLFTQTRVGLNRRAAARHTEDFRRSNDLGGRPFTMYKFRTMRADADRIAGQVWATPGDSRVTPLGRFLRRYRLDELPQLFNVLRGDMNVVGPRPEQPAIFAALRRQIGAYPLRQRVLPGITGLAQINQQYDTSLDDVLRKVRWDLE